MKQALELSQYLRPERVLDLAKVSKEDLFESLLDLIVQDAAIKNPEAVRKAVWDREHQDSTAIGHGIAIPHARCNLADDFVIGFARIKEGVDYQNGDGSSVQLVCMIVASDNQDTKYIRLLSRLMLRMGNPDFIQALLAAPDTAAIYDLLRSTR